MVQVIKDNLKGIQDACKKHHVRSLYLVGSATREEHFTPESDVDLLYRFRKEDIAEMDYADNYFELLFELQELLRRKVDLVAEEKMCNPYLIEHINSSKLVIYKA